MIFNLFLSFHSQIGPSFLTYTSKRIGASKWMELCMELHEAILNMELVVQTIWKKHFQAIPLLFQLANTAVLAKYHLQLIRELI